MDDISKSSELFDDSNKPWKAPSSNINASISQHNADNNIGTLTKSNLNLPLSPSMPSNANQIDSPTRYHLSLSQTFLAANSVPNFLRNLNNPELPMSSYRQHKINKGIKNRRFLVIPANIQISQPIDNKSIKSHDEKSLYSGSSTSFKPPGFISPSSSSLYPNAQTPPTYLPATTVSHNNNRCTLINTQSFEFSIHNNNNNNNFTTHDRLSVNSGKVDQLNNEFRRGQCESVNNNNTTNNNCFSKASFILGEDEVISNCFHNNSNNDNNHIINSHNNNNSIAIDNKMLENKNNGDDINNENTCLSDAIHQNNNNAVTSGIYHNNKLDNNYLCSCNETIINGTGLNLPGRTLSYICNDECDYSNKISLSQITNHSNQTPLVNFRPKMQNSSMRSVVSALITPDLQQQHHDHHQQMSLQAPNFQRIIPSSSYVFANSPAKSQSGFTLARCGPTGMPSGSGQTLLTPTQIYSDATSIRSLASIGVGSTDGKRIIIRRVPNSPTEFLDMINSPIKKPIGYATEDDDESYGYTSEDHSTTKPRRQHWANKMQFVLACIAYSVGLGNVWRFPYICYKSGGGAFLIPYFIILIVCSTPMLYMELAIGQYTGRGPIGALGQICPLFKGAGLASVVISFLMSTYYSVIIAYSIYYFFTSMKPEMPWIGCNNRWNTIDCWVPERKNVNMTPSNISRSPAEEFFENKVLQISAGIEFPGTMRWELFVCLICAWLLVYFATWKSIKSSAKVRYFTATFPFFLIIVLMGRALTLDGAADGLRYFFRPKWSDLGNANIWINAASQNFMSLGIAFGSMISFASYNKFNNCILYDTLAVSGVNAITSLLVGVFAFATLGNLAWEQGTTVRDVISDGPGFIFVVYPQVMAKMPYAQLWAVMFFFMLLLLGLNSQFAIVEVVVTSVQDGFPNWIKQKLGYHEVLVLLVCVVSFLFGLPNLIQGGIYYFQLMDHYAASISIMFLAFFQMIAIAWFYGASRLSKNVKQMTGKSPAWYLKTCWVLCVPALLVSLWIFSLINYKEPTYHNGRYVYPEWAYGIGWTIASLSLICIPAYAGINIARASGKNLCEKIMNTIKPNIYSCPLCGEHHCEHDFPGEQYLLQQHELSPVVQPKIILKNPPPAHIHKKNEKQQIKPLLTSNNEPNISIVEDESTSGQIQNEMQSKS